MSSKITLNEAMGTLKTMFPTMDETLMKNILYKTKGHMEHTIEILLGMQEEVGDSGTPNAGFASPSPAPPNNNKPITEESQLRHNLPSDFLRYDLTQLDQPIAGRNQVSEDQKLAEKLQRQLLFEESLHNAGLLNRSPSSKQTAPKPQQSHASQGIGSRPQASQGSQESSITQNLSKLSEIAKKKLEEFKKKFTSGASTSTANNRQYEYTSLLNQNTSPDGEDDDFYDNKRL